ncbi:zinc finger protein 70-like [Labrus mixtus]|uniref:zinc finger protein 70-like n=1 Tax=Labrus mixtus TaxID=508554 RepID=UPI0029C0A8CE|nr:zinc finger protein 70-like [Labrus mixtus]
MSSVESLRGFVNERLTAAAEEIFRVFQRTIVEYEEEIERQRRLLGDVLNPEIKLRRIELPQQHVCKEEEVLTDQLLCTQERNSSLDQEDPEPPQVKEEQEEISTSQEGEQLELKQEDETFSGTPTHEECDDSDAEPTKRRRKNNGRCNNVYIPNSPHFQTSPRSEKRCNSCDTCGKTFKYKSRLQTHVNVHTGERPYSCEVCGKDFRLSGVLLVHMRTHTGEKPYMCKTCGRYFRHHGELTIHMRTHTGERPYNCSTCGKSFCRKAELTRHVRIHTGEKPYSCKTCGRSFRISSDLGTHRRRVHDREKPYVCKICAKRFFASSDLAKHMKLHAGK